MDINKLREPIDCFNTSLGKLCLFSLRGKDQIKLAKKCKNLENVDTDKFIQTYMILVCFPVESLVDQKYRPESSTLTQENIDKLSTKEIETFAQLVINHHPELYKKPKRTKENGIVHVSFEDGETIHEKKEEETFSKYLQRLTSLNSKKREQSLLRMMGTSTSILSNWHNNSIFKTLDRLNPTNKLFKNMEKLFPSQTYIEKSLTKLARDHLHQFTVANIPYLKEVSFFDSILKKYQPILDQASLASIGNVNSIGHISKLDHLINNSINSLSFENTITNTVNRFERYIPKDYTPEPLLGQELDTFNDTINSWINQTDNLEDCGKNLEEKIEESDLPPKLKIEYYNSLFNIFMVILTLYLFHLSGVQNQVMLQEEMTKQLAPLHKELSLTKENQQKKQSKIDEISKKLDEIQKLVIKNSSVTKPSAYKFSIVNALDVYEDNSICSNIIHSLPIGTVLFLLDENEDWTKIRWVSNTDNTTHEGWVLNNYLHSFDEQDD